MTIRIWSTYRTASASPHAKSGGLCFFGHFNFHLAYQPGSKNTKPDALSPRFNPPARDPAPDTILRPEVFISAIDLDIETMVRSSLGEGAAPSTCQDNQLFVPIGVCPQVLLWGHSSNLSGHPGISRTITFLGKKLLVAGVMSGRQGRLCLLGLCPS